MATTVSDTFSELKVLPIEEGSCLLRGYGLHEIRGAGDQHDLVFHYSTNPQQAIEDGDGVDSTVERTGKFSKLLNGSLYLGVGNQTKINPVYLPKEDKDIWVMDIVGCDTGAAKIFIDAVVETMPLPTSPARIVVATSNPSTVFDSPSLDHRQQFIAGISMRAGVRPKKFLTLFTSIPYLGFGKRTSPSGSRTLRQYLLRESVVDTRIRSEPEILVHQTWFLVFDNAKIGIFRSRDDDNLIRAPLFPYQKRGGAFQALVHMISNSLTSSEKAALGFLRGKVTALLAAQLSPQFNIDKSAASFGRYISDIFTMIQVIRFQIETLENLRQIFQTSYGRAMDPRPQWNEHEIPFMHGQREQMGDATNSITAIIAEREKIHQELGTWVKELELLRTLSMQQDQTVTQQSMQKSLDKQGQTITVFTLVTSLFLPLGFLSSYYGMNPPNYKASIKTPGEFWEISAPVTIVIFGIMSLFLFGHDSKMKKWLKKRFRPTAERMGLVRQPSLPTHNNP